MEQLYVYYHCDEWKMNDSMSLIGVFEESKLKKILIDDLRNKDIEIDDRDEEEILKMDMWTLESLLKYGHFQKIDLNERQ